MCGQTVNECTNCPLAGHLKMTKFSEGGQESRAGRQRQTRHPTEGPGNDGYFQPHWL
jgi:hypothetical protein